MVQATAPLPPPEANNALDEQSSSANSELPTHSHVEDCPSGAEVPSCNNWTIWEPSSAVEPHLQLTFEFARHAVSGLTYTALDSLPEVQKRPSSNAIFANPRRRSRHSVHLTNQRRNPAPLPLSPSHPVLLPLRLSLLLLEETINIRTPAIIGRSCTETKPRRYSVTPRKGRRSPPYSAIRLS